MSVSLFVSPCGVLWYVIVQVYNSIICYCFFLNLPLVFLIKIEIIMHALSISHPSFNVCATPRTHNKGSTVQKKKTKLIIASQQNMLCFSFPFFVLFCSNFCVDVCFVSFIISLPTLWQQGSYAFFFHFPFCFVFVFSFIFVLMLFCFII